MLALSGEVIDLDLDSRQFDHDSYDSCVNDEDISKPRNQNPDDILSLKFVSYLTSLVSRDPIMANGLFDRTTSNVDDVLMTPVLNTPKSTDVWSSRTQPEDLNFSPEMPNDLEIGPREPPRDLPMDSDIGLRSPCDGVLAKRRKQMREMNKKAESFTTESASQENSPKDLTTRPQRSIADHQSGASSDESSLSNEARNHIPSSPRNLPGVQPPPLGARCYEDFKRPASLQISNAIKENDLPAHINPSPLAVPSPNWSAVDFFFGLETIRTPKNLDNPIFEFLGVGPGTPRSATRFKDRSPNPTMDCYTGRDQRLSPRLSPRFPIPEAPTDLSGRPPPANKAGELQPLNEVQDLSTRSLKSQSVQSSPLESTSPSPPQTSQVVPPLVIKPTQAQPSRQPNNFTTQVKTEYPKRATMNTMSKVESSHSSEMSSSSLMLHQQRGIELTRGPDKIEMSSFGSEYAYCQPPSQHLIPQCTSTTSYQNPFYNSASFHPGYHRGMFNHDLEQTSPPRPSSPSRSIFERSRYQEWASMINHPHTGSIQQNFQSQHLNMSHNTSGGSLMTDTHPWNTHVKEEPSVSPPPMAIDTTSLFKSGSGAKIKKGNTNELESGRKKRTKNQSGEREEKRGRKKNEGKVKKEFCDGTPNETKRQYVCQYCQRSYDWNYNLNRHQKYECGKENAFQCAKCGRKFPHKQNCVYHLKRKHKINYETIDQYMTAGLVIFRGASDANGHEDPVVQSAM